MPCYDDRERIIIQKQTEIMKLYVFFLFNHFQRHGHTNKAGNVLMTVLTGEAAAHAQEMTDKAVVDMCMAILQKLFPFKVKRVHFTFMHGEEKLKEI